MSVKNPFSGIAGGVAADPPQRYLGNYPRYLARGGGMRPEDDLKGFVAHGMNARDMARFYFFSLVFDQIVKEGIAGDLVELGVYRGNTATLLATMARRLGRTAYLFDTFEGFREADLRGIDARQKMQFADTSLEAVRALVGEDNVRYLQGYFPETLCGVPDDLRFSLVHIDCDLYAPISAALQYFYPRMMPGGFLIVHDYSSMAWDGAERAVDEFFADKAEPVVPLTDGAGSVVIRKARIPGQDRNWLIQKRASLFTTDWTDAGGNRLADILGAGWSGPETWGVWGIGESHELYLALTTAPSDDVQLEVDAHVFLHESHPSQHVNVVAAGTRLADWEFGHAGNRGIRSVQIPAAAFMSIGSGSYAATVEFQPRVPVRPTEVKSDSKDVRRSGLALNRIRRGTDRSG